MVSSVSVEEATDFAAAAAAAAAAMAASAMAAASGCLTPRMPPYICLISL